MSSSIVKHTIGGKDFHLVFVSDDPKAMPEVFTLDEIATTVIRAQVRIQTGILTQREYHMLDTLVALLQGLDKVDRLDGFAIVTEPKTAEYAGLDAKIYPGWTEPPSILVYKDADGNIQTAPDPIHKGISQEWGYFSADAEPPDNEPDDDPWDPDEVLRHSPLIPGPHNEPPF